SKGEWGGRGVKEKQHVSANDATNDTVNVVSSAVDEPVLGSLGGPTVEKVVFFGITMASSVPINVSVSPIDPNNFVLIFSRLTSYAKLVTEESSRKSVYFRTLLAPAGNGADVATLLDFIRAVSECFANIVYGFFLEKWVAYPVVENYVKNT
nr:hypothetical protein [Tanacetum cinerariifolium]